MIISLAAACQPDDKTPRTLPPLPGEKERMPGPVKPNTPNPHAQDPNTKKTDTSKSNEPPAPKPVVIENAGKVTAGGIEFDVPKGWKYIKPASTTRIAELTIPRAGGDSADATIIIYFFGGDAGTFDQNVDRWASQLSLPDGTPLTREKATTRDLTLGTMTAKVFEADGNYTDSMPNGEVKGKIAGAKMIVAMLEANKGGYFFKLTGPARTVVDAKATFEEMLRTVKFGK